jgi:uncharacterized protein YpmB
MHDHSSKDVVFGNAEQLEKGEEESMNISEFNSSQEGMEEGHENRLGEQGKGDSRSGSAVTTEETHQVTGTMVRGRTQPSKTFFRNTNSRRNEIMVLLPEEEQRVIEKSRATGQAETSWGEEVEREESSTKKPKIEETITVLIPEEEQRVTEKSRATGQAETSWGGGGRERRI